MKFNLLQLFAISMLLLACCLFFGRRLVGNVNFEDHEWTDEWPVTCAPLKPRLQISLKERQRQREQLRQMQSEFFSWAKQANSQRRQLNGAGYVLLGLGSACLIFGATRRDSGNLN